MKIRQVDIKGEVYDIEAYENPIPTGSVFPFAGITAPEGFLLCNGQEVSRFTYSKLYGVLGDIYGAGNGSTTFNLPNLIDRFIEGAENNVGQTLEAGLPNITGTWKQTSGYNEFTGNNGAITCGYSYSPASGAGSGWRNENISFDASRSSSIYGKSDTVQPPSVKMLYIIKY